MGVLLSSSLGPGPSFVWKALLYISLDRDCIKQLMFLDLRPTDDPASLIFRFMLPAVGDAAERLLFHPLTHCSTRPAACVRYAMDIRAVVHL